MQFGWTQTSIVIWCACSTALMLWWVIRRARKTYSFPILRLLEPRKTPSLQFVLALPPWIPFLLFVVMVTIISLLASGPFELKTRSELSEPSSNIMLVVDQSPSLSINITENDYKTKVKQIVLNLLGQGKKVTVLTNDTEIKRYEFENPSTADFTAFDSQPFFQINSLQLVEIWPIVSEATELQKSQILVVSDRDSYFWLGFTNHIQPDDPSSKVRGLNQLFWVKPFDKELSGVNYFIESAVFDQSKREKGASRQLVLKVCRTRLLQQSLAEEGVKISLMQDGKEFAGEVVRFNTNSENEMLELKPASDFRYSEPAQITIQSESGQKNFDLLTLDNNFSVTPTTESLRISVLSETASESLLDSSLYAFGESWASLGQSVHYSTYSQYSGLNKKRDDLLVLVETSQSFGEYCKKIATAKGSTANRIWVVPNDLTQNYKQICDCSSFFLDPKSPESFVRKFCPAQVVSQDLTETLSSLGGRSFGGNIDEPESSFAFEFDQTLVQTNDQTIKQKQSQNAAAIATKPTFSIWKIPLDPGPLLSHIKIFRLVSSFYQEWMQKLKTSSDSSSVQLAQNVRLEESRLSLVESSQLPHEIDPAEFLKPSKIDQDTALTRSSRTYQVREHPLAFALAVFGVLAMMAEALILFFSRQKV